MVDIWLFPSPIGIWNVSFVEGGKLENPAMRTNNKLNLSLTSSPGFKPRPQQCPLVTPPRKGVKCSFLNIIPKEVTRAPNLSVQQN